MRASHQPRPNDRLTQRSSVGGTIGGWILDVSVPERVDEIAVNGDDRIDLGWCRSVAENGMERVKEPDGLRVS